MVYLGLRLTINDIEPGGRLSMFFFQIPFPSSSKHTSLSILMYTHLSGLTLYQQSLVARIPFLLSVLLIDSIGRIRERFLVDGLYKINDQKQVCSKLFCHTTRMAKIS